MSKIMVVKRSVLFGKDYFQGFKRHNEIDFEKRILENYEYVERDVAEKNEQLKQPIGYCVLLDPKTKKIFLYRRATRDEDYKEKRLQGKWSIGIGGHIERADVKEENPIRGSMLRELKEEVGLDNVLKIETLGYINDDSNSVGRVHFGILYVVEIENELSWESKEIEQGKMVGIEEFARMCESDAENVESWSCIALNGLKEYIS